MTTTQDEKKIVEGAVEAGNLAKRAVEKGLNVSKRDFTSIADQNKVDVAAQAAFAAAAGGYVATHLAPVSTIVVGGKLDKAETVGRVALGQSGDHSIF